MSRVVTVANVKVAPQTMSTYICRMDNTQGAPHDGAVGDARKRHLEHKHVFDGDNVVQRIVNAWDCCGTCAGFVYALSVEPLRERANKAEAERDEYKARYAELENALSWDTTCLNCSNLMDKNYEQYVRLETAKKAEAELAELRRRIAELADEWEGQNHGPVVAMGWNPAGDLRALLNGEGL